MKIKLKKGLDLKLAGAIESPSAPVQVDVGECAIVPDDYHGFLPKLEVKEGDKVSIGQPLLHDKIYEEVKIVSPAAGTVKSIVRGERRKIERIVITVSSPDYASIALPSKLDRSSALYLLCQSGMWVRMRQRPYDIVPRPDVVPRDIFVTAIESAPLAVSYVSAIEGKQKALAKGVEVLRQLTDGHVYISHSSDWTLGNIPGAEMVEIEGPHPAGNVSVQIANINPINKGEVVWGLDVITLCKIGEIVLTGKFDPMTIVALTGSEVQKPHLLSTIEGAAIAPLLKGQLKNSDHHVRIISGNVLTGIAVDMDGYLHFPYRQITVIPEGDDVAEFMGWASLSPSKMSVSRSFPGHFLGRKFAPDARLLGGRRAMIMSGDLDKVMPMDIMTEYLLKAIISRDIESMEKLGIYEVAPEDFALAEYVDTSKQPIQQIVRDGLDYLRKELE